MSVAVLRGDAANLPLPDGSVDLICTSPPYFGLRSYSDGGKAYNGQIGAESTPREYVAALVECTREWMRVLKPSGSIFVNLGDKYSGGAGGGGDLVDAGHSSGGSNPHRKATRPVAGYRPKSLLGLPWRYALACMDDLGLILRREIIWSKPNGLPESVTDRCRSSHEYLFHLVKQPRYYAAVDEIREPHSNPSGGGRQRAAGTDRYAGLEATSARAFVEAGVQGKQTTLQSAAPNPLGKLPGSVWEIAAAPLVVPKHLGIDHFAAYPPELCRRIILGWSPPGICLECGDGRWPVTVKRATGRVEDPSSWSETVAYFPAEGRAPITKTTFQRGVTSTIIGYACTCTPYTDHPGTEDTGPWREYHLNRWTPPPTRPAVVLDPFAGTGTTMLTASTLGRIGIGVDRSADYCRLATWRCADPGEKARALGVPKPKPVPDGAVPLFGMDEVSA